MKSLCPKCNIDLKGDYKSIKEKQHEILLLKVMYGQCSLKNKEEDIRKRGFCDCCGANMNDIQLNNTKDILKDIEG